MLIKLLLTFLILCGVTSLVPGADKASTSSPGATVFDVQLIWGTNGEKPKDKHLNDVDAKVTERLKSVFKWNSYYQVCHKPVSIPKDTGRKLRLSEKCEIQVQDLGGSRVEVCLFGNGKLVVKKAQAVVPNEMIVLAGDAVDDTAWFVILTPAK